eukprot:ANDGO_08060.mRNA.1 ATP-dependent RNA helicase RhlE
MANFKSLGLIDPLLKAIHEAGYVTPTAVQSLAIPVVLARHDLMAGAQTGTGKTAAFTLPILQILAATMQQSARIAKRPIRTLILGPTRELAAQIEESVRTYGMHMPIKSCVVYGGVGIGPQIATLKEGKVDILVATPGRLLDHQQQGTVDLSHVEILVLDEADRMLDMGFIHDLKKIIRLLPQARQNLMFSATFSDEIRALASGMLHNPVQIDVTPKNSAAETVKQTAFSVDKAHKKDLLIKLIKEGNWRQVLVFGRTKHGANQLAKKLDQAGIAAAALHGNKSQNARTKALEDFKTGAIPVLVATDLAARGLDIDLLPHVVNYDIPHVPEDYVHRIGRTGRAGCTGEAVSFITADEARQWKDIEKLLGRVVPKTQFGPVSIPSKEGDVDSDDARPPRQPRHSHPRQERASQQQIDRPMSQYEQERQQRMNQQRQQNVERPQSQQTEARPQRQQGNRNQHFDRPQQQQQQQQQQPRQRPQLGPLNPQERPYSAQPRQPQQQNDRSALPQQQQQQRQQRPANSNPPHQQQDTRRQRPQQLEQRPQQLEQRPQQPQQLPEQRSQQQQVRRPRTAVEESGNGSNAEPSKNAKRHRGSRPGPPGNADPNTHTA